MAESQLNYNYHEDGKRKGLKVKRQPQVPADKVLAQSTTHKTTTKNSEWAWQQPCCGQWAVGGGFVGGGRTLGNAEICCILWGKFT